MTGSVAANPIELDRLDRQILRCLQLNPRAPFSRIAGAIAMSEQTVARRYRRLHREGALRVVAAVDPRALGESDWMVRVSTRPEATMDIARALSRRDDIAWVSIGSASDIICAVRSHNARDREGLLVDRLPRTTAVLDVAAFVILRRFVGGSASDWVGLQDALTPEQEAEVGVDRRRPPNDSGIRLERADYAMLEVLSRDGRAGYGTLARACRTVRGTRHPPARNPARIGRRLLRRRCRGRSARIPRVCLRLADRGTCAPRLGLRGLVAASAGAVRRRHQRSRERRRLCHVPESGRAVRLCDRPARQHRRRPARSR